MPLQVWIGAFQTGCIAALFGLGYQIIHGTSRVVMFPLGGVAAMTALFSADLATSSGWAPVPAVLVAIVVAAGVAVAVDRIVLHPIQRASGADQLAVVVGTIGVLFALQQLSGVLFGRLNLRSPLVIELSTHSFRGATVTSHWLLTIGTTIAVFLLVMALMRWTRQGRYLRAVGSNPLAARLMGLNEGRLRAVAFMIGGAIAGIGGVLHGAQSGVRFDAGFDWAMMGFLALIIGGANRPIAPLAGGILLAVAQAFVSLKLGTAWTHYMTLVIVIVFFSVRPQGLFAAKARV